MKLAAAAPLAAAALFAAGSAWLWHELADTRRKLDESTEVVRQLNARLGDETRLRGVQQQALVAQQATPPPSVALTTTSSAGAPVSDTTTVENALRSSPRVELQSPATLRMIHNQMRANTRRNYRDFVAEIGLNDEQADKFYDLIAEKQNLRLHVGGPEDVPDGESQIQQTEQLRRKNSQDIATLIGNAGAQALTEYEASFGARFEVDALREQLNAADLPMNDAQRKRLIKLALEDQQQYPHPKFAEGLTQEEFQKQYLAWDREETERMLARAKPVLTSEQYQIYEDARKSRLEMQEQSLLHPGSEIVINSGGNSTSSVISFTSTNDEAAPAKPQPATKNP